MKAWTELTVGNFAALKDKKRRLNMKIKMKKQEMSLSEKMLLLSIIPEQPKLPYDLEDWIGSDGVRLFDKNNG